MFKNRTAGLLTIFIQANYTKEVCMKEKIDISVRNIVEFVLRSGDLGGAEFSPSRLQQGIRAHQKLQQTEGRYIEKEASLSMISTVMDITFNISGRADGIILKDEIYIIDEIKSTLRNAKDVSEDPVHLAQAKFYGYMYAVKHELDIVGVQVTYYGVHDSSINTYFHLYDKNELFQFVDFVMKSYAEFMKLLMKLRKERDESLLDLEFPFESYRKGQKKLVNDCYRAIRDDKRLFVKAPTGIGKTVSTLYPALKSLTYHDNERIFYLTSKTVNKAAALDTLALLEKNGLRVRAIALTAKDKVCPYESCDTQVCEYASGHYDRINAAVWDILENETVMPRETVIRYSESHKVCAFELSLDIALYCDAVIGDYNYAFDPLVYLKRFFDKEQGKYIFLMDEAHNFIDRARDMFSKSVSKQPFLELRKEIRKSTKDRMMIEKEVDDILRNASRVNSAFLKLKSDDAEYAMSKPSEGLIVALMDFCELCEGFFSSDTTMLKQESYYQMLLQLYFECSAFIKIFQFYDDHYTTIITQRDKDITVKLFCVDPSELIKEGMDRAKSLIAFSATLIPASYYIQMMGGIKDAVYLMLESPFDPKNLSVIIDSSVSAKYRNRALSIAPIARKLTAAVKARKGNYMAFFPSYEYMQSVYDEMMAQDSGVELVIQQRGLSEQQREDFLQGFSVQNEKYMLAFAVMGGIFSEGIDLSGDRLVGAFIVSVGLPGISLEKDIIMEYFTARGKNGFDYAYRYSAMNKVMQASGRVIRTAEDRGIVMLLDERFTERKYIDLMPPEWSHYRVIRDEKKLSEHLENFWNKNEGE